MRRVLDASALVSYVEREKGHGLVAAALKEALENEDPLLMSAVNWGEAVYVLQRHFGAAKAQEVVSMVGAFPIDVVPVDKAFAEQAAAFKAAGKLNYADGFAAALAESSGGELLTSDRDFEAVKDRIRIVWL